MFCCRIGGRENFFHCSKCSKFLFHFLFFLHLMVYSEFGIVLERDLTALLYFGHDLGCCYSTILRNSHPCVEGAMHHDCPVCFEVWSPLSMFCRLTLPPWPYLLHGHMFAILNLLVENSCNFVFSVSLWVKKRCDSYALWAHHSQELLWGNAGTLPVSSHFR